MSPEEQLRMDVLSACAEKASALFQIMAVMQEPGSVEEGPNDGLSIQPSGQFAWSITARSKDRPLPDTLLCTGEINERTISMVEFNGVKKRPSAQEVWKF